MEKLRRHAKEICKQCEDRGYTVEETRLLSSIMKDEIRQCEEAYKKSKFKALVK